MILFDFMTDLEMQNWLFERYTNLPEYYREEIADGTFNVRDCCFRMMIEVEEQKDAATKRVEELEDLLTSARHIAERNGEDVAWKRFSERLAKAGIGAISPKTFRNLEGDE